MPSSAGLSLGVTPLSARAAPFGGGLPRTRTCRECRAPSCRPVLSSETLSKAEMVQYLQRPIGKPRATVFNVQSCLILINLKLNGHARPLRQTARF